ncbi:carboxypeptidase S [Guyanagaster necrorhizus]|uniref:Carboxypeptidase S n=1 Tax=Guyanagaster necrorhizus TaxID=856835 RepID=A0A9P7VN93_9AGAR|nr:carboxypeptidase S [Guyanagaster necrorhizus MCA 3950]KAG7444316.1 carboxypeptidase S [Guyanagaster necrorhizus MCA 3950]
MSSKGQGAVLSMPVNTGTGRSSQLSRYVMYTLILVVLLWGPLPMSEIVMEHVQDWKSYSIDYYHDGVDAKDALASSCQQVDALYPSKHASFWSELGDIIGTDEFKTKAISWLSGAVQIPTESYDSMDDVGVDPRWEAFGPFHDYLLNSYPLTHASLSLKKVNTWGLLYEWTGTDPTLKPIVLAAHQDVVPVDPKTIDEWIHPPYSGYFDGEVIWGRGSSDDKSGLIGTMSAVETLLEKGFKPSRTVILAFGFDEEASGVYGAASLGKAMLEIYGEDAFAFLIDEGGGFTDQYGTIFATPGIAEKGYIDVKVEVASPGGHSSIPPSHTSIGLLSALLVEFEENPYVPKLSREDVLYSTLQCYTAYGTNVPKQLRHAMEHSAHSEWALRALEKILFKEPFFKSLVETTQAIDLIHGGVKSNALPEQAYAVVNHRISTLSSVGKTEAHDTATVRKLAHKFNLTFTAFGESISEVGAPSKGSLTLSDAFGTALEPAPRTPLYGDEAVPWRLLSGTIKSTYNAHRSITGKDNIAVGPGMSTGNTDTKFYWKLTPHIFRYNHKNSGYGPNRLSGVHTVNENMSVDALLEMIRFFTTLILNADEYDL